MNCNIKCITGITLILVAINISAQPEPELPLIPDKQGTFEILGMPVYENCGFTKIEVASNHQKITELVNIVRKNPVLSDIKGFDGRARIYYVSCKDNGNYGVPARISFEFASWYRKKDGTATRGFIEPPEWSMIINKIKPSTNRWHFSAFTFSEGPDYFVVPSKKETILAGIDIYDGECFVIYNPDRPSYWLPVTIKEAFTNLKKNTTAANLLEIIEKEYAAIPLTDLDKPAYYGGGGFLSRVSSDSQHSPVVRINPEYWDKSLPKSAIQFIYFRSVPNKDYYRRLKEEYLQNNSISYNLARFEESFGMQDIKALVPLIGN
jgi:hypothetical protein